jgi:hypothetical protein
MGPAFVRPTLLDKSDRYRAAATTDRLSAPPFKGLIGAARAVRLVLEDTHWIMDRRGVMTMDCLMRYTLATVGGATAIAIMLLLYPADQGVLAMAAKYAADEPKLVQFMLDMGYPKIGEWCGEFAASVIKRAGGTPPSGAAIASNWRKYGTQDAMPHLGDVAVADRGVPTGETGSHVGFVTDIDLKNDTFTLESGDSCDVFTTRKIGGFSFRRPPNNVLSALTGNGSPSGAAIACASVAPSIGVYPLVAAASSPNLDDCSLGSLDTDHYDEVQNGPQVAAWSRGRTLFDEPEHMQGLLGFCEVGSGWSFPAGRIE